MIIAAYKPPTFLINSLKEIGIDSVFDMTWSLSDDYDALITFDPDTTFDMDIAIIAYDYSGDLFANKCEKARRLVDDKGWTLYGPIFGCDYINTLFLPYKYDLSNRRFRHRAKPAKISWIEQKYEWRTFFPVQKQCDNVFWRKSKRTLLRVQGITSNYRNEHILPERQEVQRILAMQTKIGVLSTDGYIGRWFNLLLEEYALPYLDFSGIIDYPAASRNITLQEIQNMSSTEFESFWYACEEWAKKHMGLDRWYYG